MTDTNRRAMQLLRWSRALYPLLFAVFPVLSIAASNPGDYSLGDVFAIVGVFAAGACLGLMLILVLLRGRLELAALATALAVALFYVYPAFARTVAGFWRPLASSEVLLPLAVLAGVGLVLLLAKHGTRLEGLSAFLALMGTLLVAWSAARLVANEWRGTRAARASALVREFAQPVPLRRDAVPALANRPDIYLIVLDSYPNAQVLRDYFAFDNSAFEDSLRALGFTIPGGVRSNYAHTFLSLASLLNMDHMTKLADELGHDASDRWLPGHLIESNRAARFLRSQGYRFVFFPSGWWAPTARNRNADMQFQSQSGFSLGRELDRTDLRRQLVEHTLLRFLRTRRPERVDHEHLTRSFAAIEDYVSEARPVFVFAHFMLPHHPYVVDAQCRGIPIVQGYHVPRGSDRDKRLFLNQLKCANRLVLEAIPRILAASRRPTVILLQADHGTVTQWPWRHPDVPPSESEARERLGAFGAYYLPGDGGSVFPDTISAVNLLRHVFSQYLAADLPPVSDSMYFSYIARPYKFYPVDSQYRVTDVDTSRSARPPVSNYD